MTSNRPVSPCSPASSRIARSRERRTALHRVGVLLLGFTLHGVAGAKPATPSTDAANAGEQRGSTREEGDAAARVRQLVRDGEQAFQAGQLERARTLLQQAWALRNSYDIAATIGQIDLELGRYAEAATYLRFSLDNFAPTESDSALEHVKQGFAQAKGRVTTLRVKVDRDGAVIRVDGELVGKSPLREVFVTPATHVVEVELDGQRAQRTVAGRPGEEVSVQLALGSRGPVRASPAPAASPGTAEHDAGAEPLARRNPVPWIIGSVATLAGVTAGVILTVRADETERELAGLRSQTASVGPGACNNPPSTLAALCTRQADAAERYDRERNWSTISFAVAGAAALGTLGYVLWMPGADSGRANSRRPTGPALHASAGPGQGALWVSGDF